MMGHGAWGGQKGSINCCRLRKLQVLTDNLLPGSAPPCNNSSHATFASRTERGKEEEEIVREGEREGGVGASGEGHLQP